MNDGPALAEAEAPASFQTVEVHFKGNRRAFFTWHLPEDPLHLREAVVVEAGRGLDFGRVSKVGDARREGLRRQLHRLRGRRRKGAGGPAHRGPAGVAGRDRHRQ